jgi:ribonucleoside-triphosphate reductase
MQRSSVSFVVNLVGLHNAVYGILGYDNNKEGKEIIHKVIETAVDVASKKGKELGVNVLVGMTQSDGSNRFITLDGEKYGKDSVLNISSNEAYSEGITLDAGIITKLTAKSDEITECNKMATILNGSMLVQLNIPKGTKANEIKKVIEKTSSLISSFKPVMKVPICGNCGLKDEKLVDKCPACKSPFII